MTSSTEFHWNQKGRIALSLLKDKIGHVEVSIWKVLYIILDIQLTYLKFQNNTVYRHLKTLLINVKKNCKTLAGFKLITCKSIANALTYIVQYCWISEIGGKYVHVGPYLISLVISKENTSRYADVTRRLDELFRNISSFNDIRSYGFLVFLKYFFVSIISVCLILRIWSTTKGIEILYR